MEVVFRFHTRWGAPISGDGVRILVVLLDAEERLLWTSGELATTIREPTDFPVSVPDMEGVAYLYVGVYDLEDATPVTVYRDGEAIAEFTGIWSDQWLEATVELPQPTSIWPVVAAIGAGVLLVGGIALASRKR